MGQKINWPVRKYRFYNALSNIKGSHRNQMFWALKAIKYYYKAWPKADGWAKEQEYIFKMKSRIKEMNHP